MLRVWWTLTLQIAFVVLLLEFCCTSNVDIWQNNASQQRRTSLAYSTLKENSVPRRHNQQEDP